MFIWLLHLTQHADVYNDVLIEDVSSRSQCVLVVTPTVDILSEVQILAKLN